MAPQTTNDYNPKVNSEIEETLPVVQLQDDLHSEKKQEVFMVEDTDVVKGDQVEYDENSDEAILQRYPLLKDMSQSELDKLNRRVRRRIDIRMLPTLTICLMINYLDRSNVTNAR